MVKRIIRTTTRTAISMPKPTAALTTFLLAVVFLTVTWGFETGLFWFRVM